MTDVKQHGDMENEYAAIIGMACRFPGARNLEEFWNNLIQGVGSISRFSDEELLEAGVEEKRLKQADYVKAKGILGDTDYFDAYFFDMTPREAEVLDPQHRIFLECAWHALEDAGYDPEQTDGRIGVFGGAGIAFHLYQLYTNPEVEKYASGVSIITGNDKDYLTTRISYKLNLKGPSVNVQSACSTSLVAVTMGLHSLLGYQSDMVLAGGISVLLPEKSGYYYQQGGMESPDGHCRAFDARAQGTVFSSGVGVVLLKRLSEAVQDGDHIYAVIRGAAVNNDGALKAGYTAPGIEGQVEVATEALVMAGITPDTLSYYETHGTGTRIGDPIEIAALTKAFRAYTDKKQFCAVGSVKTNIGHTDIAAGAAGLIKTALALKHGKLPPILYFHQPNPEIDFENSPFFVNTDLTEWQSGGSPRRAGVSSFGVGGTNASAVLEEAPPAYSSASVHPYKVFVFSAKTGSALQTMTLNLKEHMERYPGINLDDAAYTLQVGRRVFQHRRFVVGCDREEILGVLRGPDSPKLFTILCQTSDNPVVFMFPGQGTQYVDMALELYRGQSVFKEQIDRCCRLLEPELGFDLRGILYPVPGAAEEAGQGLNRTVNAQPALFVIQYALARLLMSWGIKPEAMVGHSVGEYTAACLSGVFSLEDALKAVATRGRLVQEMPEGSMTAVLLPEREIAPMLGPSLAIAAVNSPGVTVVSGPTPDISQLEVSLKAKRIHYKGLATSHAFHSGMIEPVLEPFSRFFANISLNPPAIPFLSTVTGDWITEKEAVDPGYWVEHVRRTVRFSDSIIELLKEPRRVFLEVGPGRSLQSALKRHEDTSERSVIGTMRAPGDDYTDGQYLAMALGNLWAAGVRVDWSGYYRDEQRLRIPMPGYPFERERFAVAPSQHAPYTAGKIDRSKKKADVGEWFYIPSWTRTALPGFLRQDSPGEPGTCWAVFLDDLGLGMKITDQLEQGGKKVVRIRSGNSFRQSDDWNFTIDAGDRNHYDLVFGTLKKEGKIPNRIIHLWNITAADGEAGGLSGTKQAETAGFYSPLFMEQALIRQGVLDNLHVIVVTNGVFDVSGEAVRCPEKALVMGPCRVFRQEYPAVWCRAVDVTVPPPGPGRKALAGNLVLETTVCSEEAVVAYRSGHRWRESFEPTYLESPGDRDLCLRENGVYLVTGGLGGMGLTLARFLVETVQARLILLYRSPLPGRDRWQDWLETHGDDDPVIEKIRGVLALEESGADVVLYRADVSDVDAMREMVGHAAKRFGTINGIFHSAGIAGGGVIPLKTADMADEVLTPKVKGTLVLDAVSRDLDLDFFVVFSSVTAILGEAGRVDYCSANSFLDAFAHFRNSRCSGFTTSLNWGQWAVVGMAVRKGSTDAPVLDWEQPAEPGPGPFLRRLGRRDEEEVYRVDLDPREDWVMSAHLLLGIPTLVGTAYLDIARAVAQRHTPEKAVILKNLYFLAPFMVDTGEVKELKLFTRQSDNICKFTFKSRQQNSDNRDGAWEDHMIGEMHFTDAPQPAHYDLNQLIAGMSGDIDTTPFYHSADEDQTVPVLQFGPQWGELVEVYPGQNEWLAHIELPGRFHDDLEAFPLHPAVLDVATAFALRYITHLKDALFLPFNYQRLTIHAPLTPTIYSFARLRGEPGSESETLSFDVAIMDPQGNELVDIENYTLKRVPQTFLESGMDSRRGQAAEGEAILSSSPAVIDQSENSKDILPDEGIEAVRRCLGARPVPQFVISETDFMALIEENLPSSAPDESKENAAAAAAKPTHSRPAIATPYVDPTNEVERSVADIWQTVLGINQVGLHDNFMELGGNSLLAIQAMTNTAGLFQVDLTIDTFLKTPTVAGISAAIVEQLIELTDEETLEQMLSEVEQIPDDQVDGRG